jgi:hypothetical protein
MPEKLARLIESMKGQGYIDSKTPESSGLFFANAVWTNILLLEMPADPKRTVNEAFWVLVNMRRLLEIRATPGQGVSGSSRIKRPVLVPQQASAWPHHEPLDRVIMATGKTITRPDPIHVAIARHLTAEAAFVASGEATGNCDDAACRLTADLGIALAKVVPTTLGGCIALLTYADENDSDGTKWSDGWHEVMRSSLLAGLKLQAADGYTGRRLT